MQSFEIILATVDWTGMDRFHSLTVGRTAVETSLSTDGIVQCEIPIYRRHGDRFMQFCVKTSASCHLLVFDDEKVTRTLLFEAQPGYWIFKGDWRTESGKAGYHDCPSIATVGIMQIEVQSMDGENPVRVRIHFSSTIRNFDFDLLKSDFEHELWGLIARKSSPIRQQRRFLTNTEKVLQFPGIHHFQEFLAVFERIVLAPKRELKATTESLPARKVRPVPATYRKLSFQGHQDSLPSKANFEDVDVFENQMICRMLNDIWKIVALSKNFNSSIQQKYQLEIRHLLDFEEKLNSDWQTISQDRVDQDIQRQLMLVNDLKEKWRLVNLNFGFSGQNLTQIKILKRGNSLTILECSTSDEQKCYIEFPSTIAKLLKVHYRYDFFCDLSRAPKDFSVDGVKVPTFYVNNVGKIEGGEVEVEKSILDSHLERRKLLEANHWQQALTQEEKDQRDNELKSLAARRESLQIQIEEMNEYGEYLKELEPAINKIRDGKFFRSIGWKNAITFKPSMTFVQNPLYRSAKRAYDEILRAQGLEMKIFDLFEKACSYGVREMHQVYELWCLLGIITVLERNYDVKHERSDLVALLEAIDPDRSGIPRQIKIRFDRTIGGRIVTLFYQLTLDNGTRPDYVLEISSAGKRVWLVLDAKFKNFYRPGSLEEEIDNVMSKYNGPNNFVFLLQPCGDSKVDIKRSGYTELGGRYRMISSGESRKVEYPFHRFGYVEVHPLFTDSLRKVIGMGLEYLLELESIGVVGFSKRRDLRFPIVCILCGKAVDPDIVSKSRGVRLRSGGIFYNLVCGNQNCSGHKFTIDYCWNCETRLFKHGSYWDYHLESAWSQFDIHCPNCGKTLRDRPGFG